MESHAKFIIIGGGIAGVSCAETLAFLCPNEKIVLLTESSLIKTVANLVPLGKALTRFDVEEKDAQSMNQKVTVIVDELVRIESKTKTIFTRHNRKIKYDYLCVCTGARPKLIEQNKHVIGIRDTESVVEFQRRIKNSKKIILVGNGGIASEIAYEMKNIELDWVVKDNHISSTFVDPAAGKFFQSRLQGKTSSDGDQEKSVVKRMRYLDEGGGKVGEKGAALGPDWHRSVDISGKFKHLPSSVRVHYNNEIKEIVDQTDTEDQQPEFPLKVILSNGETICCDFVVSATGVFPNRSFEADCDFKLGPDGGIFVDELMKTSCPEVYAAGDVCFAGWEYACHWFQMRLWTQARQMGSMAGKSMAADSKKEETLQDFCFELFGHVTSLFGYQVVLLGKYNGQGLDNNYEVLLRITPDKEYVKFVLQNGRLQGAILIGETGLEETCENLILNQLDLTPYGDDILDPNIDIEDYFD